MTDKDTNDTKTTGTKTTGTKTTGTKTTGTKTTGTKTTDTDATDTFQKTKSSPAGPDAEDTVAKKANEQQSHEIQRSPAAPVYYWIDGRISETPLYWECLFRGGDTALQIDAQGHISRRWQDLDPAQIAYWGVVCAWGHYGLHLEKGYVYCNGEKVYLQDTLRPDTLGFTRRVCVEMGSPYVKTISATLRAGDVCLQIRLVPDFRVSLTTPSR